MSPFRVPQAEPVETLCCVSRAPSRRQSTIAVALSVARTLLSAEEEGGRGWTRAVRRGAHQVSKPDITNGRPQMDDAHPARLKLCYAAKGSETAQSGSDDKGGKK